MQHPFQCLATVEPPRAGAPFLVVACGSKLVTTTLGQSSKIFEWTAGTPNVSSEAKTGDDDERPSKKQKTDSASSPQGPNVIKLAVSPDHQHVAAVTDDKCLRVFQINADGTLDELSQRFMPKRPCAIQILPDNATVLCGDKFGDVYSLPLLSAEETNDTTSGAEVKDSSKVAQAFKPSATNTTVHTQRNRKALESQLKQKNLVPKTKEPLKFEHKLLLGHVSMLTDLLFATKEVEGKQRGYVITADRDEHIRISRGPPQNHIIEGYCLCHKEFISKICLVPGTDLLVSGGGDDWIGVWDWQNFGLRKKIDLLGPVKASIASHSAADQPDNVAVSGIWIVPLRQDQPATGATTSELAVVVACEKIPCLAICPAADLCKDDAKFEIWWTGKPVLDVTDVGGIVTISYDSRDGDSKGRLECTVLHMFPDRVIGSIPYPAYKESADQLSAVTQEGTTDEKIDSLVYGVANMRKRGYQNDEEGAEEEAAGAE